MVGFACVGALVVSGNHLDESKKLRRRNIGAVFIVAAMTYTFSVLVSSNIVFNGPPISLLVNEGFGEQRIGWLLAGVIVDGTMRIWEEFHHSS